MYATMTLCFWCGRLGTIEQPGPGATPVPRRWKILPLTISSNLKPKQTRLQRFQDDRVPFCPDYGTDKCQPSMNRQRSEAKKAAKIAA